MGVRHDLTVAERLVAGDEPDGVYGIADARIVDHFLYFIDDLGVSAGIRQLRPVGVKREAIPAELHVLLYFLRCLARIPSQESLPDLLFADTALMLRLGFNAHQIEHGVTQRGAARRKGPRRNLPVDPEAVTDNVVKLDLGEVRRFLHDTLRKLWAAHPSVPAKGLYIIDGSMIEPGESTKGAGRTSRPKTVRTTDGNKTVIEVILGFKMVWMWSAETGLPVAVAMGTAEMDERAFVRALVKQAKEVLAGRGEIGTLLLDRGFLDGPGLYELDAAGIRFVMPARHDLRVYEEARRAVVNDVPTHVRHAGSRARPVRQRVPGGGPLKVEDRTIAAVGVENCTTFTTFAPAVDVVEGEHRKRLRKDFVPPRINAVVLTREDGRKKVDFVLLTNGPVTRPLAVVDDYDERSLIENQGHRELKQAWHLEKPPRRTAAGTEIHMSFVVLAYALTQGYRAWLDAQVKEDDAGRPTTLGQAVRRIAAENHDKLLVFVGETYGIYYTSEFSMLLGRNVKHPNPKGAHNLDALMERLRASTPKG
jgi:hypothetical protein